MDNIGFRKNSLILRNNQVCQIAWNALGFDELLDQPVPLSNDIVTAFGFQQAIDKDVYFIECTDVTDLLSINYHDGVVSISINSDEVVLPHIKFAHQLQNLYLELAGKELEFNPWLGVKVILDGKEITGIMPITYKPSKE